jgi:membrane carboxypeptidase/penicillin-binding protein PbpC
MNPDRAAAAGQEPFTAATVIADVRTAFLTAEGEPYVPHNYDMQWHGPVSVRTALASSYNLPAVKTLDVIGVSALIGQAQRQGITSFQPARAGEQEHPYGLALTLGGGEVSLLELTGAYAAFANGGYKVTPYAIERIEDVDGHVLWRADHTTRFTFHALDPGVAYLITDILSDDDARAPSFGRNSVLKLSRPAAVKTGTTTDWRDNWTVGYTPDLVGGVWVGNADNTPMLGVSGVSGAGPIWRDVMEMAQRGRPARAFQQPAGLVRAEVCIDSGLLPTQWCARRRSELFISGTTPTEYDTVYRPLAIDRCTGGPAGPETAAECREQRVFRIYPPELREWALAQGIEQPADHETWRLSRAAPNHDQLVAHTNTSPGGLALISPDPNSVFRLSAGIPGDLQQVRLAARPLGAALPQEVTFLVDGKPVGRATRLPFEIWWPMQPGAHHIEAVADDATGQQVTSEGIWIEVE